MKEIRIKAVHITNYRKIIDAKINMEDNITVIAGANNGGKTSLVELFNAVFGSQKGKFRKEDIPVEECHKWSNEVYPIFASAFQSGQKQEENLKNIFTQIESIAKLEDALPADYSRSSSGL